MGLFDGMFKKKKQEKTKNVEIPWREYIISGDTVIVMTETYTGTVDDVVFDDGSRMPAQEYIKMERRKYKDNFYTKQKYPVFNGNIYLYEEMMSGLRFNLDVKRLLQREEIESVVFTDKKLMDDNQIDLSEKQDKSIVGRMESLDDKKTLVISTQKDNTGINLNKSCSKMFNEFYGLKQIFWNNYVKAEDVENLSNMFSKCESLENVDVSYFDVSNLKNVSGMFDGCTSLKAIVSFEGNAGRLTNMKRMFASCISLKKLDLSGIEAENIRNTEEMFVDCSKLMSLNIKKLGTDKEEYDSNLMFCNCYRLDELACEDEKIIAEYLNPDEYTADELKKWSVERKVIKE